jgi:hypothetical protein
MPTPGGKNDEQEIGNSRVAQIMDFDTTDVIVNLGYIEGPKEKYYETHTYDYARDGQ